MFYILPRFKSVEKSFKIFSQNRLTTLFFEWLKNFPREKKVVAIDFNK